MGPAWSGPPPRITQTSRLRPVPSSTARLLAATRLATAARRLSCASNWRPTRLSIPPTYDRAIADLHARRDRLSANSRPSLNISLAAQNAAALRRKSASTGGRVRRSGRSLGQSGFGTSIERQRAVVQQPAGPGRGAGDCPRLWATRGVGDQAQQSVRRGHRRPDCPSACRKALAGDPLSAFGSVLGFNRTVDDETAEMLCEPGLFIEAIVAPDFEAGAVGLLTSKPRWRDNVRLMQVGGLDDPPPPIQRNGSSAVACWSRMPID